MEVEEALLIGSIKLNLFQQPDNNSISKSDSHLNR